MPLPAVSYLLAVGAPAAHLAGGGDVMLQRGRQLGQVQEQVPRALDHGGAARHLALGADQLDGVQQVAARVALVAASVL